MSLGDSQSLPPSELSDTVLAPANDPWLGRRLKKYALAARLGQGGMGVVYLAEDTVLKRVVAIKMISPAQMSDPHVAQRFLREARAAARLQHANVASLYDIDSDQGAHFLVMEFVPGPTAQQVVEKRGPLPWRLATQIIADACRGLAAAHAARLIHRDIKPANILISQTGEVKLSDFGLAKHSEDSQSPATQSGHVMGTPHYMSPEQGRNETVDERSDLYSLGATYYALLTGSPPFVGKDPFATIYAHISQPVPDPRERVKDIPDTCVQIIEQAMAKRRGDRFASASAMLQALEAALGPDRESLAPLAEGFAIATTTPHSRTGPDIRHPAGRRGLWLAGGVAMLLVAILGVGVLSCGGAALLFALFHEEVSQETLIAELQSRNPEFSGKLKNVQTRDGRIVALALIADELVDIAPIARLTDLEELDISSVTPKSQLKELAPLGRLKKLTHLKLHGLASATDFEFLRNLKALTHLDVGGTRIDRLDMISELPIRELNIGATHVESLAPLSKLPLEVLEAGSAYGLKSLKGLPTANLRKLSIESTLVPDLRGLENAEKLEYLDFSWTKATRDRRQQLDGREVAGPMHADDRKTLVALQNLRTLIGEFTPAEKAKLEKELKAVRRLESRPPGNRPP